LKEFGTKLKKLTKIGIELNKINKKLKLNWI